MFHYLAAFETDTKRKLAMELRRTELLKVFLSTSKSAFEVFHKEMSYELGEAYMTMYELKLEKIAQKNPLVFQNADKAIKLADKKKCNEYCVLTIAMFSHFIGMYTLTPEQLGAQGSYLVMSADQLAALNPVMPRGARLPGLLCCMYFLVQILSQAMTLSHEIFRGPCGRYSVHTRV